MTFQIPEWKPTEAKGIKGNRVPIGCILTIGTRNPFHGAPEHKDKFFFKVPNSSKIELGNKKRSVEARENHPAFSIWHDSASPDQRKIVYGNLMHHDRRDIFESSYTCYSAQGHKSPDNKRPFCQGDGEKAIRYANGEFKEIVCPNEKCEFRLGETPSCKPHFRLVFRLAWPKDEKGIMPKMLCKFASSSYNNLEGTAGFFRYIDEQMSMIGIDNPSYYGIPFMLTLGEKTSNKRKARYPVVSISPADDILSFVQKRDEYFSHMSKNSIEILGSESIRSPQQQSLEEKLEDWNNTTARPYIPGRNE